ncbi:MAG: hypothetical protein IJC49_03995 [Clostridia bacterium]|nr:hypothetical protein [Clostridia bacterium]
MNISIKKTVAVLLIIGICILYFAACGVKEDGGSSADTSDALLSSGESSGLTNSGEASSAVSSAEQSSADKAETSVNDTADSSNEDSTATSDESSTAKPDDSSMAKPDDSSVISPDDSSAPPPASSEPSEDSSVAPPVSSAPPVESSVAPPPVSSVAPPPGSVIPSEESSEESSYVPKDPSDPLTPIPESLSADPIDSHFNNSLFLGYSIMMHFGRYVGQWRTEIDSTIMGNSINVGAVGISFWSNSQQSPSMSSNSLPRYRGVAYNFEDLPSATGCTTMYIGLTCYSEMKVYSDPQSASEEVIEGVNKIKAKNPNVNIVLLSGTYNTGTFEQLGSRYSKRLSNENIRKFNNFILDYCNQNGVDFVDVSTPLTNGYGRMPIEYSSDNDYHIAKDAFLIWIDVLRDYARKKEAGTWKNYTVMPELGM